jgi:hypothetical protein
VLPLGSWFTYSLDPDDAFTMAADVLAASPATSSGADSSQDDSEGGTTSWTFSSTGLSINSEIRGDAATITAATLTISLERGENDDEVVGPDTFTGTFVIATSRGTVEGTITGEAVLAGGVWQLRGMSEFDRGPSRIRNGVGGFSASIANGVTESVSDDTVSWKLDGSNNAS